MIRECTKEEFDQYVDFAYKMALDPTKSGYPTYCDGVKTKAMLVERASEAFVRETERMLLFASDGEVQGLIHYYWIPEDHYLDTCLFLINRETERAMEAMPATDLVGTTCFWGSPPTTAQRRRILPSMDLNASS